MKVLFTGTLSPAHWYMAERLTRDSHQVVLLGNGAGPNPSNIHADSHDFSPSHPRVPRIMKTSRFDAVVFFFAYQSVGLPTQAFSQDGLLDDLMRIQSSVVESGVTYFLLVTTGSVFGVGQQGEEWEAPSPDTLSGTLLHAAETCLQYYEAAGIRTLLMRVTNLYIPGVKDGFFARARQAAAEKQSLLLHGSPETVFDFLHADDLAVFINLVLEAPLTGVVHLACGKSLPCQNIVQMLAERFAGLSVTYDHEMVRDSLICTGRAAQETDWVPRHDWLDAEEFEAIVSADLSMKPPSRWQRIRLWARKVLLNKSVPWIELVLLAALVNYLTRLADRYALFRFVDFWLFFVVLMGSIHGTVIGLIAALITCVFYCIDWIQAGNDAYLLLVNVDNWLPLMMYILSGSLFGYLHEDANTKMNLLEIEAEQQRGETKFMESMYQRALADRNKLQEQVMRSRDSYGRIYNIAKELDALQPTQVFLSTLNVLEDVMENNSVALYSCTQDFSYARLVVHSRELGSQFARSHDHPLDRSLKLKKYPLLAESLAKGNLFINDTLDYQYPDFAAPIMHDHKPIAVVALWNVPFEKRMLYYRNLFSVVIGLVQSSMIRALQYFSAVKALYIEQTVILDDEAFRTSLDIYRKMRQQQASESLLLRIDGTEELTLQEIDSRLRQAMRSTDVCGRLRGHYFLLLPQAEASDLPQIERRYRNVGLTLSLTEMEEPSNG